MAASPKPTLTLAADTGSSSTDRVTASGAVEVSGLVLGNSALDPSKLTPQNTTIDFSRELAQENQVLKAPAGTLIAYGKKGYSGWAYRLVPANGELAINNATFGDPLYGVVKAAYVATTSLAPAGTALNTWQYSTDFGANWSAPVAVSGSNRFVVPDGVYAAGQVKVRQTVVTPPAAAPTSGNLIENGSFERGWTGTGWTGLASLPGWKAVDRFEIWGTGMTRASDGNYLLELDYSYAQDAISQSVATLNGATYNLQFDAKSRGGGNESIEVYWRGERISTVVVNKTSEWTTFSFTVTGSGGNDELMLREPASENNGLGGLLDNFRLSVLSAPPASPSSSSALESEASLEAFTVDTRAPELSLTAPGGTDSVVSTQAGDATVSGRAEPGSTVTLVTTSSRTTDFSAGQVPSWLRFDVPNASIGNVVFDAVAGELDFSAKGRTNIWTGRDNAPFAYVSRPVVSLNETWYIESRVRLDNRTERETIAGITFSNDRNGDFQYASPSFYIDAWHYQGTNATLQGLGTNNPFVSAGDATNLNGQAADVYLRVEVTEKGSTDDYRFFYRKAVNQPWKQVGDVYSYGIDNARAALFYKTGSAKSGLASFDDVAVGKIGDVVLANDIAVATDGTFSVALTPAQLELMGQGAGKSLTAVQKDAAGNIGRSNEARFAISTEVVPVRITSIGGGDGKVSLESKETGKGPLKLKLDQYTGYWSNDLANLRNYTANFIPQDNRKLYSVSTDVIDYTDDQGGFAGEMPYDKRWPAAEALNVWGTGGVNNEFFVKISGNFFIEDAAKYRFRTYNDDGVFLIVDGKTIISDPTLHPEAVFTGDLDLPAGNHQLELFFFENGGEASLEFSVSRFDASTGQWGPYSLVGKDPSIKAESLVVADNLIVGVGAPNRSVTLWLGSDRIGDVLVDGNGQFQYAMSAQDMARLASAPAGLSLVARQTDSAGNTSSSEPAPVTLSETKPIVSQLAIGGEDSVVSSRSGDAVLSGRGEAGLRTELKVGDQLLAEVTANSNGEFSYTLTSENLKLLGQGSGKRITANQLRASGLRGELTSVAFGIDTVAPTVTIDSVGYGDSRVSSNSIERGQGPVQFSIDQYLGYRSNQLADLRSYVSAYSSSGSSNLYSATDSVIDFTDDQGGFAGELPYDKRWPAAETLNVWGTGGINNDFFVRIHTPFYVAQEGSYRFRTYNDDGVFLLIDGRTVIEDSGIHPEQIFTGDVSLTVGNHDLELYFFEYGGEASLEFSVSQYDPVSNSWGDYQLVGQSPALKAQSILKQDNVVEGRAEPGSTVVLRTPQGELGRVTADADGRFVYSLTPSNLSLIAAQKPSTSITAEQVDAAGNQGVSAASTISAKLTPPEITLTAIGGADAVLSSQPGDALLNGTAEAGLPVTVLFNGEVLGVTAPANASGQFSYVFTAGDLARLGQGGPFQLTARQQDDYGNVGVRTSASFTIDTVAPSIAIPVPGTVMAIGGVDGVISTQVGDATLAGTAEPDRNLEILINGQLLATVPVASSGTFSYTLSEADIKTIGQGLQKPFTLIQRDAAGNIGSSAFVVDVDTVAPDPPTVLGVASDAVVSGVPQDNAITGKTDPGSSVTLLVGSLPLATVQANSKGQFTYLLSQNDLELIGQGTFTLYAEIADAAGNTARSSGFQFKVDTVAPAVPTLDSVGGDDSVVSTSGSVGVTSTVDKQVIGRADPGSRVDLFNASRLLGRVTTGGDGRFSYELTAANLVTLGQGTAKTIRAIATDSAGNSSDSTTAFAFAIDTVAPQAPSIATFGGADGVLSSLPGDNLIVGVAEAGSSVDLLVLQGASRLFPIEPIVADSKGAWSYAFSGDQLAVLQQAQASAAALSIQAVAKDAAGNQGVSTAITPKIDILAPVISLTSIGGSDAVVSAATADNMVQGKAEANSVVNVLYGTTKLGEAKTAQDGSFSYALTSSNLKTIGEGSDKRVLVTQVDRAGNLGATGSAAFGVDVTAPGKAVIRGLGGTDKIVTSRAGDFTLTGTAEVGSTVEIQYVSGPRRIALGSLQVPQGGQFSYALTPENLELIRQGPGKSIVVASRDAAGNSSESAAVDFSVEAIWKTGTAAADTLDFVSGVDAITGRAGADTFAMASLGSALVGSGQTPVFDRLIDFEIGVDRLDAPVAVAASAVRDLGTIQALSTTHLSQLLSATAFPANGAAVFRQLDPQIGQRTFIAINDSKAGFNARTDAIIEITGFTGNTSALSLI